MHHVFRWNDWNIEHGVWPEEAEYVVDHATQPWPEKIEDDKRRVWGQTPEGRYLQVIYVHDPPPLVYVIHTRELTPKERRQCRRRR